MSEDNFTCGPHDFSTNNIKKYDEHMAKFEHEYDLHTNCQSCGEPLHIKPKLKLSVSAKRIPIGYMCKPCKKNAVEAPEIKEAGEMISQ